MMMISLSKVLSVLDEHRGVILKERKQHIKGTDGYGSLSRRLDLLNRLKKEFSNLPDTDEPTLGV
jgi:hypothetical protein